MTLLPDDELKAVRERDAVFKQGGNGWLIDELVADRRALLAHIDALQQQLDAARKDAERYRRLRENAWQHTDYDTGEELDAAIDAAKEGM